MQKVSRFCFFWAWTNSGKMVQSRFHLGCSLWNDFLMSPAEKSSKFLVKGLVFSGAIAGHDLKRCPLLSSCNSHPLMAWSGMHDSLEVLVDQYGFNVDDILTLWTKKAKDFHFFCVIGWVSLKILSFGVLKFFFLFDSFKLSNPHWLTACDGLDSHSKVCWSQLFIVWRTKDDQWGPGQEQLANQAVTRPWLEISF